jgi:hypothetical protein
MGQQHAIDRQIGEGQFDLVDQRGLAGALARPMQHALRRRHDGDHARGLAAEGAEKGRRVAEPDHRHAARVGPDFAQALADDAPGRAPEAGGVEILKIDHVGAHGRSVAGVPRML